MWLQGKVEVIVDGGGNLGVGVDVGVDVEVNVEVGVGLGVVVAGEEDVE